MKTLGIIGGIGPESTIEYYRKIIAIYRELNPDASYPRIQINSIDMTRMLKLISANQLGDVTQFLLEETERLAAADVQIALLASNTPHIVFEAVNQLSSIPLISIVEATADKVVEKKLKRVGLLGTQFTMQGGFYAKVLSAKNVALIVPHENEQEFIHNKYMTELVFGDIREKTHARILRIIDRMIEENGIQGVILGGTELPLLLTESHYRGIPFFDTTQLHVEKAVSLMLSSW